MKRPPGLLALPRGSTRADEQRALLRALCSSRNVTAHSGREDVLADKQAAKLRRRDNREQREREKATRTGDSPAQKAEQTRRRNEASADRNLKNRAESGDAA
jgi:hypothetical protein